MGRGIMVAGVRSGSGKTTLSMGLMKVLSEYYRVIPFKVGPDYLDPSYHALACGRKGYNLDLFLLGEERLCSLYREKTAQGDISIVEGVMGLFDGMQESSWGSSAHIAKVLDLPVLLVVDGAKMGRSISALLKGFRDFDPQVKVVGVVLNRVKTLSHYRLLRRCIEEDTGLAVFGFLPEDTHFALPERHLGLVPQEEVGYGKECLARVSEAVKRWIDVERIFNVAEESPVPQEKEEMEEERIPVAIAEDEAFRFVYQEGRELFSVCGGELVPFSPLRDATLPPGVCGLYLPGGFPEVFAPLLSENLSLRESICHALSSGMPTYAECGGLMYLARSLTYEGKTYPMVGALSVQVLMTERLRRFGYVEVQVVVDNVLAMRGTVLRGHEFHYSEVVGSAQTSYIVRKPSRRKVSWLCGFTASNLLATYVHIDFYAYPERLTHFLTQCRQWKGERRDDESDTPCRPRKSD